MVMALAMALSLLPAVSLGAAAADAPATPTIASNASKVTAEGATNTVYATSEAGTTAETTKLTFQYTSDLAGKLEYCFAWRGRDSAIGYVGYVGDYNSNYNYSAWTSVPATGTPTGEVSVANMNGTATMVYVRVKATADTPASAGSRALYNIQATGCQIWNPFIRVSRIRYGDTKITQIRADAANRQFSGTVTWTPATETDTGDTFLPNTVYTATVTLDPYSSVYANRFRSEYPEILLYHQV